MTAKEGGGYENNKNIIHKAGHITRQGPSAVVFYSSYVSLIKKLVRREKEEKKKREQQFKLTCKLEPE